MATETPAEQWKILQDQVGKALKQYFPLDGRKQQLVLHDLHWDEKEASHSDIRSQEDAKDQKKTWGVPIYGDIGLVDKASGKEIDRAHVRLMTLPKPTNRYSYIVDGTERQVDHMWRLRSGIYANKHSNDKYSTEFNLAPPGFAREHRLFTPFDMKTRQFKLRYGSSLHTNLYSVLKMMGVPDEDMKKAWGDEIYKANANDKVKEDILKFQEALQKRGVRADKPGYEAAAASLIKEFDKTKLLPETTKAMFGKPIDRVNGEALLLASKRILGVVRGEIPPDDRNSLVFKGLHGADDFLFEKLTHYKTKKAVGGKIANGLDRKSKVRDIVASGLFNKPMKEFFNKSTLCKNPEQVNPLEMLANHRATTIVGEEGGIQNERAILPSMKLVNSSHLGFLDPVHTPESSRTGINLNLPLGVKKIGREAMAQVYDIKEKKLIRVNPAQLHSENILLPDQVTIDAKGNLKPIGPEVKMQEASTHDIVMRPFKDARYLIPSAHQLYDEATNLIPFLQNDQGNRTSVASRQLGQAMSLIHREQPLVQTQAGSKSSWEKVIGIPWSSTSQVDGKIVAIKRSAKNGYPESIIIQDAGKKKHETQIYNHFALNDAKTMIHSTPLVAVGDEVKKGQVIADSNFTRDGHLALGTNLRVAYLPYKGYNFEDGIVISETAAQKLTSEHLHRHSIEIDPEKDKLSKRTFSAHMATLSKKLTSHQMDKLDEDGLIQVGQKVGHGDILIAAVGKPDFTGEAARVMGRLGKKAMSYRDKSVLWTSDHQGEVVKVVKDAGGRGATVYVKTLEPMEIGDKLVGRHGNKAIVTKILPDHDMPRIGHAEGPPAEVLMNPLGVPTRINLGQMLETAAAKIAEKTGKPYLVNNFGGGGIDYNEKVQKDLKEAGLDDSGAEAVYDPHTKRKLGDVLTGPQYILKLKHQVEKKLAVRSYGSGPGDYTIDQAPKGTGSAHPGQAMGSLEFYSLLAHGAKANLREMATYKADSQIDDQMNPWAHVDFWDRVRNGQPLPPPRPTFAYRKFEHLLTGLGINVKKDGHQLQLTPLTDEGVLKLSNGEIKDGGRLLRGKDARELEKGLFDPKITGGLPTDVGKGLHWSHIALAEPLPNPIFVGTAQHPGPAVVLSGLKFKEFEEVAKGRQAIDGKTGGYAIQHLLDKVNVKEELTKTLASLSTLRGTPLDHANRKAKYLLALKQLGMSPTKAYVMNHVPVLPPVFRPIVPMPDGSLRFDDVNHYYQNLALVNDKLKNKIKDLPDSVNTELREQVYDLLKSTQGLGGQPVYESNRKLKGIIDIIKGAEQPKAGFFQAKLIKRRQDLSMRSTIIPEPAMHLDHVGIPKEAAMELYKPFVIREMRSLNYNPIQALKEIKAGSDIAWRSLAKAMEARPILLKRDPALHKASIMAFKPRLVEGKAIQIHPLVTHGFNADFDGDTMSAFVPLSPEAVKEAQKMFPSNNLFSSTSGDIMYSPDQEALLGLHLMSKWGKQSGKTFTTFEEAAKAHEKGLIEPTDVISIGGLKTTYGRLQLGKRLPAAFVDEAWAKQMQDPHFVLVKRSKKDDPAGTVGVNNLLDRIAREDPKNYASTVDHLKDLGNEHSYRAGFSFSLKDLNVNKEMRAGIMDKADAAAARVKEGKHSPKERDEKLIKIYSEATDEMGKQFKPYFAKSDNKIYQAVASGARGKWDQFRQMTIAPMLVQDGSGRTLPSPVKRSYSEGLDVGDYWTSMNGARMGTLQRVEGTQEPGSLSKDIVNTNISNMIVSKDCGTTQGIALPIHDTDLPDRLLATPITAGGHVIKAGTLVTPDLVAFLKRYKVDKVVVRSPLKCAHGQGTCASCFGLNENGHLHELGVNIGVISGQALGEPANQLSMDAFHSGGVSSAAVGKVGKMTRLKQLLKLPKILPNEATLAKASGVVQKIEKDFATNGHNIWIAGEKHFAPAQRLLRYEDREESPLKVGMVVKRGDALTDGPKNPHHLLALTDIHSVQNYLTNELHNSIYKDERVKRRNIETVVRGLTNLTTVRDPGDNMDADFLSGDTALRTVVEEHNRNLPAGGTPITHTPILRGIEQTALDQHEDWMARLNYRHLQDTLLEGTAKGWKTDLHGTNPVPAYARGAEFGVGAPGKRHHY